MNNTIHTIVVSDKKGMITVDKDGLRVSVDDAVTWTLSPDSDSTAELYIEFSHEGFKRLKYALYPKGGFGVVAHTPGNYTYCVSADNGKRRVDPMIIVCPILPDGAGT